MKRPIFIEMLRVLFLGLVVWAGLPVGAQSWSALDGLATGDRIKVRDVSGQKYDGVLASVTPEAIRLNAPGGEVSIERVRVKRVQVRSASRRVVNTLIGAGVGLALGVVADQTLGAYFRNETGESSGQQAITYLAPIGLCTGIAAAFPAYRTVYRIR